jgi:hypothetical protein
MGPKRFLFVFWEGGGNVPPQLGLVRRLVSRGHEVRVLTEPASSSRPWPTAPGLLMDMGPTIIPCIRNGFGTPRE